MSENESNTGDPVMENSSGAFFQLDDLVLAPDALDSSKMFQKAVIKRDFEIIIPKDEKDILIRDLKASPFSRMAENLVSFYVEIDPNIDYLAQNVVLNKYLQENKFVLPWLVPIVKDEKLIYKKKLVDSTESNYLSEASDLTAAQNNFINYANIDSTQIMVENLHNYRTVQSRVNMVNHSGAYVLRLTKNIKDDETFNAPIGYDNLQFRGSYGDWQLVQLREKAKSSRKTVVIGYDKVDKVIGERLQVVGFAQLPLNYPNVTTLHKIPDLIDVSVNTRLLRGGGSPSDVNASLEGILREYLPDVGRILQTRNLNHVTDLTVLLDLFKRYGHSIQSLTEANRRAITSLILTNIENIPVHTYEITDRLTYPELERELIKSGIDSKEGILGSSVLEHPVMIKYGLKFEQFPHIFHKYLRIINRLDNGAVWTTLINPESTPNDIKAAAHHYQVIRQNKEIALDLEASYANNLRKTVENHSLYIHLLEANPLDNILEVTTEKRDKIAWYQYYKLGYPDRTGKNILYHGKVLGCEHEYDRLYKMFEDPNDDYPLGKAYTRIIPNDGIVCSYCGDTLEDQDEIVTQGYDSNGQRLTTFAGNDGLIRETSNIDIFFKNKSEIIRHGEKLVDQWLNIANKRFKPKAVKALKYRLLRPFETAIMNNQYFYGLQQNPNKLVKAKQDRQFGEWFLNKYNISTADARDPLNYIFIQKIFSFYYSISSVYELVIQRLAVFLVFLNWHLSDEDPAYLNPANLLSYWSNPEQIGLVFMDYNISDKNMWLGLKPGAKGGNPFYDDFAEKASESKTIPQGDLTIQAYEAKLREEFMTRRRKFLYTNGIEGGVWNGFNSFEHDVIMMWSEYQQSIGKPSVMEVLSQSFARYWAQWLVTNPLEAKSIEENAKISLIPQRGVLTEATPRNVRPLFDRYLAQRKFIINRKLEDLYMGLINENIYNIQLNIQSEAGPREQIMTGQEQVILRKMFLLDKLTCDHWTNMESLGISGIEEDVDRLQQITTFKQEVAILENQMNSTSPVFHWPITGGFIVRDNRERLFEFFRYIYQPPNLLDENGNYPFVSIVTAMPSGRPDVKVAADDLAPMNSLIQKDLNFLEKTINIDTFGLVTYIPELVKWEATSYGVANGEMNGVQSCQDTNPNKDDDNRIGGNEERLQFEYITMDPNEFEKLFADVVTDDFDKMPMKYQLTNMKKYVINLMRMRIHLMSRITARNQMILYGLERYVHLFDQQAFNLAFGGFNEEQDDQLGRIFTNTEIDDLVQESRHENSKRQKEVVRQLQSIFVSDLVRQLRNVRIQSGKFVKGSSKRGTNKTPKGDDLDAGQIFQEFIRILMNEIRDDTAVNNVDFNHKEINQTFQSVSMWHKIDNAEKKGELEFMIAKLNLASREDDEVVMEEGVTGDKASGTEPTEDGLDDLDHENDEDDYDDALDN